MSYDIRMALFRTALATSALPAPPSYRRRLSEEEWINTSQPWGNIKSRVLAWVMAAGAFKRIPLSCQQQELPQEEVIAPIVESFGISYGALAGKVRWTLTIESGRADEEYDFGSNVHDQDLLSQQYYESLLRDPDVNKKLRRTSFRLRACKVGFGAGLGFSIVLPPICMATMYSLQPSSILANAATSATVAALCIGAGLFSDQRLRRWTAERDMSKLWELGRKPLVKSWLSMTNSHPFKPIGLSVGGPEPLEMEGRDIIEATAPYAEKTIKICLDNNVGFTLTAKPGHPSHANSCARLRVEPALDNG